MIGAIGARAAKKKDERIRPFNKFFVAERCVLGERRKWLRGPDRDELFEIRRPPLPPEVGFRGWRGFRGIVLRKVQHAGRNIAVAT